MGCNRVLVWLVLLAFWCFSCNGIKQHDQECLMVNESRVVDGLKFDLFTKMYQEEKDTTRYDDFFFKLYVRISDVRKSRSFLFSSKNEDEYNARYKYLSFGAGRDFLLKIDTATIMPIGYTFLPSNEVSQYDELVYSFRLPKKTFSDIYCSDVSIQYWYIDHIAGIGNVCFRPQ